MDHQLAKDACVLYLENKDTVSLSKKCDLISLHCIGVYADRVLTTVGYRGR